MKGTKHTVTNKLNYVRAAISPNMHSVCFYFTSVKSKSYKHEGVRIYFCSWLALVLMFYTLTLVSFWWATKSCVAKNALL